MNTNAILYGRVSTGLQDTAAQEARGKEYIAYKHYSIAAEFYDDDVSGSVAIWERPQGRLLRHRLKTGDIKHLVVAKLDRLGRSASDLLNTVKLLDSLHIVLHIVDLGGDSLSTQGAAGRLMFTVLAGMAEYERELIRGRIQDKLNLKRSNGELIGTVPYGFDAVETGAVTHKGVKVRKLVDNVAEQGWILRMVELRAAGHGYHTIARLLNDGGAPTKKGAGTLINVGERRSVKRGADGAESVTLNPQRSTHRFTTGRWQSGNVHHVLNNDTIKAWLELQGKQAAV